MKLLYDLRKFISTITICAACVCECVYADNIHSKIHEDSVNLLAKTFLNEFVSSDDNARKLVRLYLLGVLDATEGKTWCGYKTLKTVALIEVIFEYMKKLTPTQLERRASMVIEESLKKSFPCKARVGENHTPDSFAASP